MLRNSSLHVLQDARLRQPYSDDPDNTEFTATMEIYAGKFFPLDILQTSFMNQRLRMKGLKLSIAFNCMTKIHKHGIIDGVLTTKHPSSLETCFS